MDNNPKGMASDAGGVASPTGRAFVPDGIEPPSVSPVPASIPDAAHDAIPARGFYEGSGGWNDGRLGQAYDLIASAIKERGQRTFRHPLLDEIEMMDREFVS